jgi:cysteine-rich repeat protein
VSHPPRRLGRFALALGVLALGSSCGARTEVTGLGAGNERALDRDPRCGDGVVDPATDQDEPEACDDANDRADDACLSTCVRATCGDGFVRVGAEACDPGRADAECTSDCALPSCGDGIIQDGEECDGGAGCSPLCLLPSCGDGFVDEGEACDEGAANDDALAAYVVYAGTIYDASPIQTGEDVVSFYDYRSASGHTGYEDVGKSTVFLFYEPAATALALVTLSGIDLDDTGVSQGKGRVVQTFAGIPDGAEILVADDRPEEFDFVGPNEILGRFRFDDNTDGGVVDLPWPGDYVIDIDTTLERGITTWGVISATGQFIDGGENLHATLVIQSTPSACRTDCTIPRCNDGILDAGEVCDDGNADAGDGCAPDCSGP